MITAAEIASFRAAGADSEDTERLKAELAQIRRERHPLYLTAAEFEEILVWKLTQQIGRQRHLRAANTEEIIRAVTGLALTIASADKGYEIELRLNILSALRGVDIPVASAVLALVFPEEYAVIDFRVWKQLFDEDRWAFSVPNYKKYMVKIRALADELGWPVQEVDHAIWEYDKKTRK
jgi:hypothetical protein